MMLFTIAAAATAAVRRAIVAQRIVVIHTRTAARLPDGNLKLVWEEGDVMEGINIFKEGSNPVVKADSEYPEWLWDSLKERPRKSEDAEPGSDMYLRLKRREKMAAYRKAHKKVKSKKKSKK